MSLSFVRDPRWLTVARATAYRNVLLAILTLAAAGWIVLSRGGIDLYGKPIGTDFISFWTAARFALAGYPGRAYDVAAHWAAQMAEFNGVPLNYTAFFYPPVFLLICLPLGLLPYFWSLACWLGLTGIGYWQAIRSLATKPGMTPAIIGFPAVYVNVMHGQNGFLTTALYGGAVANLAARPLVAGAFFGCLVYKPHLAVIVPLALAVGRQWRTLIAMAGAATALCLATTTAFGVGIWQAFLSQAPLAAAAMEQDLVGFEKLQSVFAAAKLLGIGTVAAYSAQIVVVALVAGPILYLCATRPMDRGTGALIVMASLLVTPFLLGYDLVLLAIPLVWVLGEAERDGFLPWEKSALAVGFILPLVASVGVPRLHVPLTPLVLLALFAVVTRRLWRSGRVA